MHQENKRSNQFFGISTIIVILFPLILYSVWRQYSYSGDDLQYASQIDQLATGDIIYHPAGGQSFDTNITQTSQRLNVNPRYILEWPTSIVVVNTWNMLGWKENVIDPILSLRLLVGITGIVFLFLTIKRLTQNILISLIVTLNLVIVDSYWYYSTHLDQTMNMIAFVCISLFFLVRFWNDNKPSLMIWVLILMVLATLYNFTALLTASVFILALALFGAKPNQNKWADVRRQVNVFLKFSLLYGFLVGLIIITLLLIWVSPKILFTAEYWQSATFQGHPEYLVDPVRDAGRAVLGFLKSQITYPNANGSLQEFWDISSFRDRAVMLFFYAIILGINIVPFIYLLFQYKHLDKFRSIIWILVIWIAGMSAFNWIWDPGYIKYWILPILGWWVIVAIFLCILREQKKRWYPFALAFFLFYAVLGFGINFSVRYLPQSNPNANPNIYISDILKESDPKALFISMGHPLDFYITYLTRRDLVAPNLIVYGSGGDYEVATDIVSLRIKQHQAVNGPIYFMDIPNGDLLANNWLNRLGIEVIKPAWNFDEAIIYEVRSR